MAQQFLDGAQVGAIGQQVRGVGVAETVRMNRGVAAEQRRVKLDDAADAAIDVSRPPRWLRKTARSSRTTARSSR